ncbi:MAG TPA: outer membrane protein assembly factor BamE [Holosporales bacterium]|nr:outer membrane protein assembly factor BamE [Holosporales bacterium]
MKKLGHFLFPVATLALLAACSPRVDYRGKAPEVRDLTQIQAGVHTSHDVLAAIGSPTFESTYGPKTWFYIHKKTETTSFFKPNIIEKNTIAITFNDKGVVERLEDMDPEMQEIDPITHTTPTVGADRTMLQQVFSNFGRVARKPEKK